MRSDVVFMVLVAVWAAKVPGRQANSGCVSVSTTSERCKLPSPSTNDFKCIPGSQIPQRSQVEYEDSENEGHYCETAPTSSSESNWALCDKGCFNPEDGSPMEFDTDEFGMSVMCKTVPMKCKFPFTHLGSTYHRCTDSSLTGQTAESEKFLWCATETDDDNNMKPGMWGMCDLGTCVAEENGNDAEDEEEMEGDETQPIYARVDISPESNSDNVSATITFEQESPSAPLIIKGHIVGLPAGLHGFHVHEIADTSDECMAAGAHFNPTNKKHGSQTSEQRHAGDLGNVNVNDEGTVTIDFRIAKGSTLFGENSLLQRTLVIHAEEDDLGQGDNDESLKTGNAGARVACAIITPAEDESQLGLAKIIIIVLVVIIVLLLILITALIIYCCKKKRQISTEKGEEGVPFQNGDMKKKPLAYDELSIPFIDASPAPTPKVGRSTERLSFFNRTPSIGRSRGSLSNENTA